MPGGTGLHPRICLASRARPAPAGLLSTPPRGSSTVGDVASAGGMSRADIDAAFSAPFRPEAEGGCPALQAPALPPAGRQPGGVWRLREALADRAYRQARRFEAAEAGGGGWSGERRGEQQRGEEGGGHGAWVRAVA